MNHTHRAHRLHRAQRVFRSLRLGAGALLAGGALTLALFGAQGAGAVAQAAPVTANMTDASHNTTVAAQTSSTNAASWLYYKRGYYLDNGWLCYGWANGAYHCTHHWHWANGQLVSDNPAWVPNYGNSPTSTGSSGNGRHVDGDGDYDNDNGDGNNGNTGGSGGNGGSGGGSVASMIQSVFGPYAGAALRVATCESSLNPNAYNAGSGASGVFQFLHSTWLTTSYAGYSPFNAWANINAAHQVFVRDGYSWREWECQP